MPAQVYLDCFDQMPVRCDNKTSPPNCTAIRNTKGNQASIVTEATVTNYIAGKKRGLSAATKLVEAQSGGIFTAKTWDTTASHDPYGTASDKPHTRTHFSAFTKRRRLMSRIPPPPSKHFGPDRLRTNRRKLNESGARVLFCPLFVRI